MKNLFELFQQCMYEVEAAGIKPGHIVDIKINSRATNRWGQCQKRGRNYYLNFNALLFDESTSEKGVKETIIHEILHTCEGCMNHGREWNRLGAIMERKYGYDISRTATAEDVGVDQTVYEAYRTSKAKYKIVCDDCGETTYRNRASNVTKYISQYRCAKCHGSLRVFRI